MRENDIYRNDCLCHLWGQWHLFFEQNHTGQVWTNQKCVLLGRTPLLRMISELSFPFLWDSARSINQFKHRIIISKRQSKRWGVTNIEHRSYWQNMYKLNNRTHEGQWHLWGWIHVSSMGTMTSFLWAKPYWPSMNQPKMCYLDEHLYFVWYQSWVFLFFKNLQDQ